MTGHAFQVLVTDDELRVSLRAVRAALRPGGRFAFETRNPAARAWEAWTPANAIEVRTPAGAVVRQTGEVLAVEGDLVTSTATFTGDGFPRPEVSQGTLRFLDVDVLTAFLTEAGLTVHELYGDFDGAPLTEASAEIVVVAGP
jgi:hypothetical protein